MTINLKLLTTEKLRPEGYPLTFIIQHKGKRKKYQVGFCLPEHFSATDNIIKSKHPDFDVLYPEIMAFKFKARDVLRSRPENVDAVYNALFGAGFAVVGTFYKMGNALINDMAANANAMERAGDRTGANKEFGNIRAYTTALESFNRFAPDVEFSGINYTLLYRYREARFTDGNAKATVSTYLRYLRAIYNKLVKLHGLADKTPFAGVFDGIKLKSHASRKKNMSADMVARIENIVHQVKSMERFTDLWLLQFYFGGADLVDIYFLKTAQLRNGRVYFSRGKTDVHVNLAVHPKAAAIIEKYLHPEAEYVFPWRKDNAGYVTFRRKMWGKLQTLQKRHGIELAGEGGKLGVKVARHTFANIGKQKGLDEDLLRELMGHERDDVDNFYKDKFPEAVRDAALFEIIG